MTDQELLLKLCDVAGKSGYGITKIELIDFTYDDPGVRRCLYSIDGASELKVSKEGAKE